MKLTRIEGSSPRMRGARARHGRYLLVRGIIPAYAGSTTCRWNQPTHRWDHPRVCGEHPCSAVSMACATGSSPRMRGALTGYPFLSVWHGIIPAYAGSTTSIYRDKFQARDHPRVCGEHSAGESNANETAGSSPRMRGAQVNRLF